MANAHCVKAGIQKRPSISLENLLKIWSQNKNNPTAPTRGHWLQKRLLLQGLQIWYLFKPIWSVLRVQGILKTSGRVCSYEFAHALNQVPKSLLKILYWRVSLAAGTIMWRNILSLKKENSFISLGLFCLETFTYIFWPFLQITRKSIL